MLLDVEPKPGGLAIVRLNGSLTRASASERLVGLLSSLKTSGHRGVTFDFSQTRRVNAAGLAALVPFKDLAGPELVALCNLPEDAKTLLQKTGLTKLLPVFDTLDQAMSDPGFAKLALMDVPAVVLCAGKGTRAAPMTQVVPKPMLDILGKPLLRHALDHLDTCGVRQVFLNPGHLGPVIHTHTRSHLGGRQSLMHVNEGQWENGAWQSAPIGSASTLKRLQTAHSAFANDLIVMCGDALTDVDLGKMLRAHRASGADATLAVSNVTRGDVSKYGIVVTNDESQITSFQEKPAREDAKSTLANAGIYIFNARVLDALPMQEGLDIATDLLPQILKRGGRMLAFQDPFHWIDVGCGKDYFAALEACLHGQFPFAAMPGNEIRRNVRAAESARVSRFARIDGPCYIGARAQIDAGARIIGPCVIGPDCLIEQKTLLRKTVLFEGVHVRSSAFLDHQIVHANWSFDHRFADGRPVPAKTIEQVASMTAGPEQIAQAV